MVKKTKILIAYFSHKGQNYSNGDIIDLKKGNTEVIAEMIARETSGELFEIKPTTDYPFVYNECIKEAKRELEAGFKPKLLETIDISSYDLIYLGYPNWWGTMPMPVWTFLEGQNFSGKVILPFCTHEGSGMGNSEQDLKKLCPDSEIRKGLPIHGSNASKALTAVENWMKQNGKA